MILFTADWHIKLGQKNVPVQWAQNRYDMFLDQLYDIDCDMHIVGGDVFDRLPTLTELAVYFKFLKSVKVPTIIFDGNHEATKKGQTFFDYLTTVSENLNPFVEIVTKTTEYTDFTILPYADLHKKGEIERCEPHKPLFTHVRGEIPPHVKPEVDLERLEVFPIVYAGDLHSHSNTQRNIVYPGSPMTTSFHRNEVQTGYLIIDYNFDWTWHQFDLPQLIRKTVEDPNEMEQTDFHHTIYELTGDVQDLAKVKNSDLLDKKVVKREMEATLDLQADMTMSDELALYLKEIMALDETKIRNIMGVFNDYSSEIEMG